jgi:trans-2,3-dihydro-3-hydroxyanthranilate isomerase
LGGKTGTAAMPRRYVTLDVFTDRRFGGNPLAVVLDAARLDTAAMQAIAREFNYSETTFILPSDDPAHTARVRIFTPTYEMPFAGHPNVGTAVALAREGSDVPTHVVFEEIAGLVPVTLEYQDGLAVGAELTAPKPLATRPGPTIAALAAASGLDPSGFVSVRHAPTIASVGVEMMFAEVASRAALAKVRPNAEAFLAAVGPELGLILYTREADKLYADLQARMMFWQAGVVEDPATGSAGVALASLLAPHDPRRDGEIVCRIAQGIEMGRPSLLRTRVVMRNGAIVSAHVGGRCVAVMRGEIDA